MVDVAAAFCITLNNNVDNDDVDIMWQIMCSISILPDKKSLKH